MYRYEMHLHTAACSRCSRASGEELIDALHRKGYAGTVLTNHFYRGNTALDRHLPWQDFMGAYVQDFERIKTYAKRYGMDVLFGLEEGYGGGLEVLIYGLSPQDFMACPGCIGFDLAELSAFVRAHGGFMASAHPFRKRSYVTAEFDTACAPLFDGVEGYNYCNLSEENEQAKAFAAEYGLTMISGGDVHTVDAVGYGGIAVSKRIRDNADLLKALRSGAFRRIEQAKIR